MDTTNLRLKSRYMNAVCNHFRVKLNQIHRLRPDATSVHKICVRFVLEIVSLEIDWDFVVTLYIDWRLLRVNFTFSIVLLSYAKILDKLLHYLWLRQEVLPSELFSLYSFDVRWTAWALRGEQWPRHLNLKNWHLLNPLKQLLHNSKTVLNITMSGLIAELSVNSANVCFGIDDLFQFICIEKSLELLTHFFILAKVFWDYFVKSGTDFLLNFVILATKSSLKICDDFLKLGLRIIHSCLLVLVVAHRNKKCSSIFGVLIKCDFARFLADYFVEPADHLLHLNIFQVAVFKRLVRLADKRRHPVFHVSEFLLCSTETNMVKCLFQIGLACEVCQFKLYFLDTTVCL